MSLIEIRPHQQSTFVSAGRTLLQLNSRGFIEDGSDGFYMMQTRILSRLRFLFDGHPCRLITSSNVEQNSWLGYFLQPQELSNQFNLGDAAAQAVELMVTATVEHGMKLEIQVANYSQYTQAFQLGIECGADFSDLGNSVVAPGMRVEESWSDTDRVLLFIGQAEGRRRPGKDVGNPIIKRTCKIQFNCDNNLSFNGTSINSPISLLPGQHFELRMNVSLIDGEKVYAPPPTMSSIASWDIDLQIAASCRDQELSTTFVRGLTRGAQDITALKYQEEEALNSEEGPTSLIAGIPKYTSLFARDSLKSAWQSSLLDPQLMKGCLLAVAKYQGTVFDDWLDERPGRMPHEIQTGPLSELHYIPSYRNYGSVTASPVFCIVLADMWRWTADETLLRSLLPAAVKAIKDADNFDYFEDTGFYMYQTRSKQGVRNQAWKDSADAIPYPDGTYVPTPLGTCGQQAYLYLAKMHLADLLDILGNKDDANVLRKHAVELKKRFNEAFWLEDEHYFALGIDAKGAPIRSIASDAGHCLACGIVDPALVPGMVRRMMQADLFNGWGIRTLSSLHKAYNPWSYHRGSVWPVEQATFCLGLARYAELDAMQKLATAQVEALGLFSQHRFPEVFAGHQRDDQHPFPAIYPDACWPQAWSASAPTMLLHSLLGTYAYAPKKHLFVDPCLPDWLPEITVRNIHVGQATVSIKFFRSGQSSNYQIIEQKGQLRVIRRRTLWQDIKNAEQIAS